MQGAQKSNAEECFKEEIQRHITVSDYISWIELLIVLTRLVDQDRIKVSHVQSRGTSILYLSLQLKSGECHI